MCKGGQEDGEEYIEGREDEREEKRNVPCLLASLHKEEDKHLSYIGVTNHPALQGAPTRPPNGGQSGHGRVREGECAEA